MWTNLIIILLEFIAKVVPAFLKSRKDSPNEVTSDIEKLSDPELDKRTSRWVRK